MGVRDVASFFAPKALRRGTELGNELIAIELPECGCKTPCACFSGREGYPEQCPGVWNCDECPKTLCSHGRSHRPDLVARAEEAIEEWACLLLAYDPVGYSDPPLASCPALAATRAARQALLVERALHKQALRHPDDMTILEDDLENFQIEAVLGKVQARLHAAWHDEEDEPIELNLDLARTVDPNDPIALRSLHFDQLVARALEAQKQALEAQKENQKPACSQCKSQRSLELTPVGPTATQAPLEEATTREAVRCEWYVMRFGTEADAQTVLAEAQRQGFRIMLADNGTTAPCLYLRDASGSIDDFLALAKKLNVTIWVQPARDPSTASEGWIEGSNHH